MSRHVRYVPLADILSHSTSVSAPPPDQAELPTLASALSWVVPARRDVTHLYSGVPIE